MRNAKKATLVFFRASSKPDSLSASRAATGHCTNIAGRPDISTPHQENSYASIFNQKGLMAGLGLQGTKITRIHPD